MTFSIVAYDPVTQEWGVATQSKFLAVGAVVPWAQANAGAIATQSYANTSFGPQGLATAGAGPERARNTRSVVGRRRRPRPATGRYCRSSRATPRPLPVSACHAWAGGLRDRTLRCRAISW